MLFSLSSDRKFEPERKSTPANLGPGVYEMIPVMGKHLGMKAPFGVRSSRDVFPPFADPPPPPGEYQPKPLSGNVGITSVFISETKRSMYSSSRTPGPGHYGELNDYKRPPPRELHHKPLRTASVMTGFVGQNVLGFNEDRNGRWQPVKAIRKSADSIGPGSYEPTLISSERSISLEKSAARPIFGKLPENPGPGTYGPLNVQEKLPIAISRTVRPTIPADGGTPAMIGPSSWVIPRTQESAVFRAKDQRNPFPPVEETPTSFAYFRPKRQHFEGGIGFGHREARNFGVPLTDGPGPGTYETPTRWVRGRNSTLNRSIEKPGNLTDWVPGPGSYKLRATWGGEENRTHGVFESKSSRKPEEPQPIPAPGTYNPRILDPLGKVPALIHEARFAKFGDWVDYSKVDLPAPDSHQTINIQPGKGRTFSTVTRDVIDKDKFPGPGHYDVVHRSLQIHSRNAKAKQASADV
jgi:hypothetical protein